MPVSVARTAPRWTVRCATVCHDGCCMPPHTSGRTVPRHVPLGEPRSDAWAGELVRGSEVATCRGKWLTAVVFSWGAWVCPLRRAAPARALVRWLGRPGKLLLPGPRLL